MFTQSDLLHLLHYNPNTGVFTWVNPLSNRVNSGDTAGCIHHSGYLYIQVKSKTYAAHRLAWLYIYGYLPPVEVDHIDGVRANNAIDNLRLSTRPENMQNKAKYASNTSGYVGVSYKQKLNKWQAAIGHKNKSIYLGVFGSPEDAYTAYLKAKQELHAFNPTTRN